MKYKAIGIIGGMGPEASKEFYGLLISHAQKIYGIEKNDDFPEVYLASIPVPDFFSNQRKQEEALFMLKNRIKSMESLPIGFYCMACNTGHLLIDELKKVTEKPFISLVEELPKYILKKKIKKVGILATPTTIKSQLYETVLATAGIELVVPEIKDTNLLGKIIIDTVAGKKYELNSVLIQHIAKRLLNRGAQGIIEGFTEIPLIFPKTHLVQVFDTLEILALAVLKKYYSGKI